MEDLIAPPFRNEMLFNQGWEDYLETPGFNPSTLVHGLKRDGVSMKHVACSMQEPSKDSPAMLIGRATHTYILEPDLFSTRYAVYSGRRDKRTHAYQDFLEDHPDAEILSPNEYDQAMRAGEAVRSHRLAAEWIAATEHEVTVLYGDAVQHKGRMDGWNVGMLMDVKGTTDHDRFGSVFARLHYGEKLAMYRHWASQVDGSQIDQVMIIAHEQDEPYDTRVIPIDSSLLDYCFDNVSKVIERLPDCIRSNHWPGMFEDSYADLDLPRYALQSEQDEVSWDE